MKKTPVLLAMLAMARMVYSKNELKPFEFGITPITIHSFKKHYYFVPDRPNMEYANGVFFRLTKQRWGIRVMASYSINSLSYSSEPNTADGYGGDIKNNDLRMGIGIQRNVFKRRQWLYSLVDIMYRTVQSNGHLYGGIAGVQQQFSDKSLGFDCFTGFGLKIHVAKAIYFSPEFGYLIATKSVNRTSTNLLSGQVTTNQFIETNANPFFRVHLTYAF